VQTRLRLGQYDAARAAAAEFQDIFGKENYFAEIMDHGLSIERRVMTDLIRLAKDLDIPLVATNDSHYTHQHEADAHEALLCVQSGSTLDDPTGSSSTATATTSRPPPRCASSSAITPRPATTRCSSPSGARWSSTPRRTTCRASRCRGRDRGQLAHQGGRGGPALPLPGGIPDKVRKQAEYETGIILQMGFPGYFLVVADFINWAKDNGIRVGPGRGSGAGSMVAYAMRSPTSTRSSTA
jgi:DNA polymerase-3 subunit alpha